MSEVALAKRRGGIRSTVTGDINKVKPILDGTAPSDQAKLRTVRSRLQHNLDRLYALDAEIQSTLADAALDAEVNSSELYDDNVLTHIAKIDVALTPPPPAPNTAASLQQAHLSSTPISPSVVSSVKLPKFEMDTFGGDPMEWQSFWDVYSAAIHENTRMGAREKFGYLLGYLTGEARELVKGYSLTESNYKEVIEALQERYGDKQRAQFAHFQALVAIEPVQSNNFKDVQRVYNECEVHVRSLVALGIEEDQFAVAFVPIIMSKLPEVLTTKLCEKNGTDQWTLKNLREWIKADLRAREMGKTSSSSTGKSQKSNEYSAQSGRNTTASSLPAPSGYKQSSQRRNTALSSNAALSSNTAQSSPSSLCIFCSKSGHYYSQCPSHPSAEARIQVLKDNNACFTCLRNDHRRENCGAKDRVCRWCERPGHHQCICLKKYGSRSKTEFKPTSNTYAHPSSTGSSFSTKPQGQDKKSGTPKKTAAVVAVAQEDDAVTDFALLQTAVVTAQSESGDKTTTGRVLMDIGSSRTYITEGLCRRLGLQPIGSTYISVGKFGSGRRSTIEVKRVRFAIVCKDGSIQPVLANVNNVITCPVARQPIDSSQYPVVNNVDLAEPMNTVPDDLEIDMLIGSDQYYNFVSTKGAITCDQLVLVPSRLGYLTAGIVPTEPSVDGSPESTLCLLSPDVRAPVQNDIVNLERFWQLEDVGVKGKKDLADVTDEQALQQFQDTVQFKDNRYYVTWPWKSKEPNLQDNFGLAYGRLRSTYGRLQQDPKFLKEYDEILQKQFEKGVVEEAPAKPEGLVNYIPHHAVIKPEKTTKVRIVFDASSKLRKDLPSLNDCLFRGPVILDNLCGLLMRFRMHKIVMISDIEKAFLQVRLQQPERDVARFLWVKDISKPLTSENLAIWRYTSVFFGSIASSFLLGATVETHLCRSGGEVAKKIRQNMYVDNIITGEDSETKAINYYRESKRLLLGASMNLREFYSNSAVVREALAPEDVGMFDEPSVLGVKWNFHTDTLRCSGPKTLEESKITKRHIAKVVAQVYDPMGWLSPLVLPGKLLIQELWRLDLAWDEKVPTSLLSEWKTIREQLVQIPDVSFPRYIGCSPSASVELHAFCDASSQACATAVYIRKEDHGHVSCDLLFSKTRLAPLKPAHTIPRLELVALTMGSNAIEFVEQHLRLPIKRKVVWSDNQCVLYWLTKEKLCTKFVERRVNEIRKKEGIEFRFVPGPENPADLPSRGCSVIELQNRSSWWHGPPWLCCSRDEWPKNRTERVLDDGDAPEETTTSLVAVVSARPTAVLDAQKFSSLLRLLRVTAYVHRFATNARLPTHERQTGTLTVHETSLARSYWEKLAQSQGFPHLQHCITPKALKRSPLSQLNVFRDQQGLLRCRGRLSFSGLSYDTQNPVLLPKNHPFTDLIIRNTHVSNCHAGVAQTLHALRQRYWVIHGRSQVRRIIRKCQRCRRVEGGPFEIPPAPNLPDFRVTEQIPFQTTGLDYLGFLTVRVSPTQTQKVWVCLFTCAASRALHLELVEDQSAEEFHLCLRRFFAVYGCPKLIVSDNASQFLTVEVAMKKLWATLVNSAELDDLATTKQIDWKRIPELSPWMGGFYERLVGIVKKHLKKTLDGVCVNVSELRTVLAEITSIVNSRPLLYVEDDVHSVQISPADLLGKSRNSVLPTFNEGYPAPAAKSAKSTVGTVVSSWKRLQAMSSSFWDTWRQGYLTSLREKHSNASQRNTSLLQPTVGSVVQIKDKVPRAQWRLGKIIKLFPSADGKIRSVSLRLSNGREITRPVKLLYPLEMYVENSENVAEKECTPYVATQNLPPGQEEDDFLGFESQDVEETEKQLDYYDHLDEMLRPAPKPSPKVVKTRPVRQKAVQAREKLRQQLSNNPEALSGRESSDEE